MPPDDPLGRSGPTLDTFLRVAASPAVGAAPGSAQPCPYGKKCTYGNKCKFFHAERGNVPIKTVTDKLKVEREYIISISIIYARYLCPNYLENLEIFDFSINRYLQTQEYLH